MSVKAFTAEKADGATRLSVRIDPDGGVTLSEDDGDGCSSVELSASGADWLVEQIVAAKWERSRGGAKPVRAEDIERFKRTGIGGRR